MSRLSWNLGASNSWNTQGLSRPVMGWLYIYIYSVHVYTLLYISLTGLLLLTYFYVPPCVKQAKTGTHESWQTHPLVRGGAWRWQDCEFTNRLKFDIEPQIWVAGSTPRQTVWPNESTVTWPWLWLRVQKVKRSRLQSFLLYICDKTFFQPLFCFILNTEL
jgi:hypothetical protein